MTAHKHERVHKMICESFGENLDSPMCRELAEHLKECPNCRIMVDTVRRTVALYQEDGREKPLPPGVGERLINLLNLPDNSPDAQ